MSLNNNQMLPTRTRNMRQMKDVLNAEDIILAEFERVMDEMYQRASLLHEELVNEAWLEKKLEDITNGIVYVQKEPGTLRIAIDLNVGSLGSQKAAEVVAFIEKWLPAHLAYTVTYERLLEAKNYITCLWQHDEVFILSEVKL